MTTKPNTDLGRRLREARLAAELTQREFAELSLVDQSAISMYESGRYVPTVQVAIRLCEALRITPNDLLLDPAEEPTP